MPTIHREDGFDFRLYPNDHHPPHVHVFKGGEEFLIELGNPPVLREERGQLSSKEIRRALEIVAEQLEKLMDAWRMLDEQR